MNQDVSYSGSTLKISYNLNKSLDSTDSDELNRDEQLIKMKKDLRLPIQKHSIKIKKNNSKAKKVKELSILDIVCSYTYLNIEQIYHLNGDFLVYLSRNKDADKYTIKLSQIQVCDRYFLCQMSPMQFLKDFNIPIEILESSQDIDKYNFAQQLKQYQTYSQQSINAIQKIIQTYQHDQQRFTQLTYHRQIYRKELITQYIKNQLKEEDFFTIVEVGPNFNYQQTETLGLFLSKGLFALIGIEESDISQYLLHTGMGDKIFFSESDKLFGTILQICSQNKFNQNHVQLDFTINTLDELKIVCNTEYQINQVNYPKELKYQADDMYQQNLEMIIIIKFDISYKQIESILNFRKNNKNIQENQSVQSIEYSILSEIFLEKYYLKQYKDFKQLNVCNYRKII